VGNTFSEVIIYPYICSCDGIITEVNNEFNDFTAFTESELIGKSLLEVGAMLRINSQIFLDDIINNYFGFIFTKSLEVREVEISFFYNKEANEKTYSFIEKSNSRLDDKLIFVEQTFKDNVMAAAVFSVPDLILLKANEKYINALEPPFNNLKNSIGKPIREFVTGFVGSKAEVIWETVLETQKTNYMKEFKSEKHAKGIVYWDVIQTPIFEKAKMKYIFETTEEVTERVLKNYRIKQQNELMKRQVDMLNLSTEAIFAWDLNGDIIYWNTGAEQLYGYSSKEAISYNCHELLKTVYPSNIKDIKSILEQDRVWKGEIEHTCKDGKKVNIETKHQVIINALGQYIVLESNRNITERKMMEEKIKTQNQKLEAIIESISDGMFILDNNYKISFLNKGGKDFFYNPGMHIDGDSFKYTKYFDMLGKELLIDEMVGSKVLKGHIIKEERIKAVRPDKTVFFSLSGNPVYDENKNIKFAIICSRDITEDIMNEELIKSEKAKLETIIENIDEGIYISNKEGKFISLNAEARKQLYEPSSIKKLGEALKIITFLDMEGNKFPLEKMPGIRALGGEKVKNFRMLLKRPDEDIIIDVNATPIFNSIGELTNVVMCSRDVTEEVEQQRTIKKQNETLNAIIENISDGLIVVDKQGKYIIKNKAIINIMQNKLQLEITPNEIDESIKIGQKYYDENGDVLNLKEGPIMKALRGMKVKNQRIVMKHNGKEIHLDVSTTPILDEKGEVKLAVSSCHDVTGLVEKDKEIRRQKEQLEAIIENMPDAFAFYNKEGQIILLNAEARKLYPHIDIHRTSKQVHAGFKYFDLNNNPILPENLSTIRALRGESIKNERIVIKRPDRIQITEVNATPIFDEDNNLVSVAVSHRDITELINSQDEIKSHQELLLKAVKDKNIALEEAIKLKDEFFYLITHEFKTPIAVINLAMQAIEYNCSGEVTGKATKYLNTIKLNVNRQLRLVNNLLDIVRIDSGYLKMNTSYFDTVHVIESIVNSIQLYAQQKKVKLKFNTKLSVRNIYFDEEKLERILLNLLSNALKFTPSGKSITVTLSSKKNKKQDMLLIRVQDEGTGIPQEKQDIIFERFGQADTSLSRQAEGTGLGLYLVKLLVNSLGGEISLESVVDKGSIFTLLLPEIKSSISCEAKASNEISSQFFSSDSRIVQSAAIEFSDIYF